MKGEGEARRSGEGQGGVFVAFCRQNGYREENSLYFSLSDDVNFIFLGLYVLAVYLRS